jgi:hypothetical protein
MCFFGKVKNCEYSTCVPWEITVKLENTDVPWDDGETGKLFNSVVPWRILGFLG